MMLCDEIIEYIDSPECRELQKELLCELAVIPAPSGHEEKRAEFCRDWLCRNGAKGVYVDEILNVIYPVGVTEDNPVVIFMAHSDVVFPDTEPLPLVREDGKLKCPGVGDDTANVTALLLAAKYIAEKEMLPKECGVLLVVNSCEEGLGNLRGSRAIVETFGDRIREFVTFDGSPHHIVTRAVGSLRYSVSVDTEGGHSYSSFGNRNAIAYLASLIDSLYSMKVPEKGCTTYNVGTIVGGTSVNTVAQHAEMLYEIRSDEKESLEFMRKHFEAATEYYRSKGVEVKVQLLGERPCMGEVDENKEKALYERAERSVVKYFGEETAVEERSGSTDCNIPLSVGIPSICVGCCTGAGAHTREEYVDTDTLPAGLKLAFEMILYHF